MAQMQSTRARSEFLSREGLCVLSLDGGGVRGLSSLLIIKALMAEVNAERGKDGHPRVKPCQLFDLIGGTSAGGIIAIMLGRLEMDVDECIEAYTSMFQTIFTSKGLPISILGKMKARYDSVVFEKCIEKILMDRGLSDAELFNDGRERCKVFVCAKDAAVTSTVLIRSYRSDELNNIPATICQAARATSAASSYFDAVTIQSYGRRFVDGGLGANNPVEHVWNETQRMWCQDDTVELDDMLKCFVSIGTGHNSIKALNEGVWKFFRVNVLSVATETEDTAERFFEGHQRLRRSKRYFRFNVQQGLQDVELQEYQAVNRIASTTTRYMDAQETRSVTKECAINLKEKQSHLSLSLDMKSIMKWKSDSIARSNGEKPITFIRYDRNDNLVNRDDAFKALDRLFAGPFCNLPISIWGLGGTGKTQIAIEYAYRLQEESSCSIFWVHAASAASFMKDYSSLGEIAGLSPELKEEDLLRAVRQWIEQQEKWLLILDNADDLTIFHENHSASEDTEIRRPKLLRFVPKSRMGTVLWISRDGGIVGTMTGVNRGVEVGAMTMQASCELYQRLSGQDEEELSRDKTELLELLELIERLPLAIVQAAAYIRKRKIPVKKYLKSFKESELRQSNLLDVEYQDAYQSDIPQSVMRTWLISMRQIAKESPCSEKILHTIAFFDNSGIPLKLVRAAAGFDIDEDEFLLSVGRLMDYSFLQGYNAADKDFTEYGQHRLVQLAMRTSFSASQVRSFSGDALRIIWSYFPHANYMTWSSCRLYLPHALKVIEWEGAKDYDLIAPQILDDIGTYYNGLGLSSEAEKVNSELLRMREEVFGNEHPVTIYAMQKLAETLCQKGRFKAAEELQVKVLQFWEARDETRPETLRAKMDPSTIWTEQGRLNDAEKRTRELVEQQKGVPGEKNPHELATTCWQQGCLDEAAKLEASSLKSHESIRGQGHLNTMTAMSNLALTLNQQGRLEESERLQIHVLEQRKEVFGDKHPYTITAMANLAGTWHRQDKLDEAERLELEVFHLSKEVLDEKDPDTIKAMANLAGTIALQEGRSAEAEELEIEVLKLFKQVLGDKHPNTITAMANLAVTYLRGGKALEAEELLNKAVTLSKEVHGNTHPHTVQAEEVLEQLTKAINRETGNSAHQTGHLKKNFKLRNIWRKRVYKWRESEDD